MKIILIALALTGICLAQPQVVHTIDAPDTGISGLGFGDGSLWAVDGTTEFAYEVDPSDGTVLQSWFCENSSKVPTGLTYAGGKVYIAMATPPDGTYAYAYRYSSTGSYEAMFSLDC